ncbi:MAG: hypothetical protein AAB538_00915 [Patescibacteria group bacterium]
MQNEDGVPVSAGREALAKILDDLTVILENPLTQIDLTGDMWRARALAVVRERVFNLFCAVAVRLGAPLPPLEEGLWRPFVPADKPSDIMAARQKWVTEQVTSQIYGGTPQNVFESLALIRVFNLFMGQGKGEGIDERVFIALMNHVLVETGYQAIRPDYSIINVALASGQPRPANTVRVLIVDDSIAEMVKTATALVGWPNIQVLLYKQGGDEYAYKLKGDEKTAAIKTVLDTIVESGAHVVLMDEGLQGIEGHEVVAAFNATREPEEALPYFVANTGGSAEELKKAGCFTNCEKGKNLAGVCYAVEVADKDISPTAAAETVQL